MKQTAHGSALLIVFVILTTIVLWVTNLWRTTLYMNDLAYAKQRYEQQFRAAESLLEYGIGSAKVLHNRWKNGASGHAVCNFAQWPPKGKKLQSLQFDSYSGNITVAKKNKKMKIHAQLLKKDVVVIGLHSTLKEMGGDESSQNTKEGDSLITFLISDWSLDER